MTVENAQGFDVNDVHVHFGECSIQKIKVDEEKLLGYLARDYLRHAVIFPLDIDYVRYNGQLLDLLARTTKMFGLVRVQVGFPKDFLSRIDSSVMEHVLGFKFHPSFDRIPVTNRDLSFFFKWLEENRKIALIHCGRWKRVASFRFAFKIAERHPELVVVMAHMGGNEYDNGMQAIEAAENCMNVYLETSNCRIPKLIETASDKLKDRVLYGSDFPWGSPLGNVYSVLDAEISSSAKRGILFDNFEKLLRRIKS